MNNKEPNEELHGVEVAKGSPDYFNFPQLPSRRIDLDLKSFYRLDFGIYKRVFRLLDFHCSLLDVVYRYFSF